MIKLIVAFFSSFTMSIVILRCKNLHLHFSADIENSGPQKNHTGLTPRIGGLAIILGIFLATILNLEQVGGVNFNVLLLLSALPTFFIGLLEDITKKISVKGRLLATASSAILLIYMLGIQIMSFGIPYLDLLFSIPAFSLIFTIFAITGLSNAYNIIDGFHGLASMVGIITLLAIAYVSYTFFDYELMILSLIMAAAILGFFILNYPLGLIFLGDGGAYLIGFWIASLSIAIVMRNPEISPWFAFLVNCYPISETLFTLYRRRIHQNKNPGLPDAIHFHTLIYKRILLPTVFKPNPVSANASTAPYLWILTILSIIPAILWFKSTPLLILFSGIFLALYIWLYTQIVRFKTPKWIQYLKIF
ncbi:glycosyltransferase family 4 protein [Polynucleobacter sp. JS-Mosq-20-D10]|uniref:MraY family glycosyltransferase n=1 Tax=Polynucleobacter sp. JS-Mosq-20-D10 TaxID=2576922 RepID=UPI001BFDB69E|nr:glycosyltransferase [Polynucleobacter sp. JS-Mosq-20-D10]QWE00798.1 glycosyltransferase family 4 protein [Polynucleobacter sp. JS-Mosq-20-D10]